MKKTILCMMAACAMIAFNSCKDKAATAEGGTAETPDTEEVTTSGNGVEGVWVGDAASLMGNLDKEAAKMFDKCEIEMTLDGSNMKTHYVLDGTVEEDGIEVSMGMTFQIEAPYTSTDETMTANFDEAKGEFDIYKFEIGGNEEIKKAMEAAGMGGDAMKEMLKEQMNSFDFKSLNKDLQTTTYSMPDNNTLVLSGEDGNSITLKRK